MFRQRFPTLLFFLHFAFFFISIIPVSLDVSAQSRREPTKTTQDKADPGITNADLKWLAGVVISTILFFLIALEWAKKAGIIKGDLDKKIERLEEALSAIYPHGLKFEKTPLGKALEEIQETNEICRETRNEMGTPPGEVLRVWQMKQQGIQNHLLLEAMAKHLAQWERDNTQFNDQLLELLEQIVRNTTRRHGP